MGNSRGVRIPKALIELCDLGEEVEVEVANGQLIFRKAGGNRLGWAEAFERRQAAPARDATPARFPSYRPTPFQHS